MIGLHTSGEYQIRLACAEDMPNIIELLPELGGDSFSERFPGKSCTDLVRWKYFHNPDGDAAVGVALCGGRVVSIVAGIPQLVRLGKNTVLAFRLGDFITTAEHRKRGLSTALVSLVCDVARERGAAFVYVRPHEAIFRSLLSRLSFVEPEQIEPRRYVELGPLVQRKVGLPASVVRGIGFDAIAKALLLPKISASVKVDALDRFGKDVDELWARTQDQYSFALVRTSHHLNWRYVDGPTPYRSWAAWRGSELAGYLVAFRAQRQPVATILDLFTHPKDEEAAATLLHVALRDMLQRGSDVIYAWTLQHGALSASYNLLRRTCRFVQKPLLHFAVRPLSEQMQMQDVTGLRRQLGAGDFDSF